MAPTSDAAERVVTKIVVLVIVILVGFLFGLGAIQNLRDGEFRTRSETVLRKENPTAFWLTTIVLALVSVGCLIVALNVLLSNAD